MFGGRHGKLGCRDRRVFGRIRRGGRGIVQLWYSRWLVAALRHTTREQRPGYEVDWAGHHFQLEFEALDADRLTAAESEAFTVANLAFVAAQADQEETAYDADCGLRCWYIALETCRSSTSSKCVIENYIACTGSMYECNDGGGY